MSEEKRGDLLRLTGLWKRQGPRGEYLAGRLGAARVFVFQNTRKATDDDPDAVVYLAPAEGAQRGGGRTEGAAGAAGEGRRGPGPAQGTGAAGRPAQIPLGGRPPASREGDPW